MAQSWKKWTPDENIYDLMIAKATNLSKESLALTFEKLATDTIVTIEFKSGFLSFRDTDEFCYEKSMDELNSYFKNENCDSEPWFLFIVENSRYVESFVEDTGDLYRDCSITHYVIVTEDLVCEILSTNPPNIQVKDKA